MQRGSDGNTLPRARYLTDEELRRLLAALAGYGFTRTRAKHRTLFLLLVNFGPRISEALALRVEDVDFQAGTITFPTLKRWHRVNGQRRRTILARSLPLGAELGATVATYIAEQGLQGTDLLFPHLQKNYAWEILKRCLRRAGLSEHYRLQDLRHSVGTRLADQTGDPVLVRDVLGHASVETTNIYLHTVQLRQKLLAIRPLL